MKTLLIFLLVSLPAFAQKPDQKFLFQVSNAGTIVYTRTTGASINFVNGGCSLNGTTGKLDCTFGGFSPPVTASQSANGTDVVTLIRKTDSTPTGNFLVFQSAALANLFSVDVLGNETANSWTGTGTTAGFVDLIGAATDSSITTGAAGWSGSTSAVSTPYRLRMPTAEPSAVTFLVSAAAASHFAQTSLVSPAPAALTDGATVTWAIASNPVASATLLFTAHGGSRTLNITGPVSGATYILKITQDGTGSEGLTLGTGCTWKVISGGSGAVTLSTAAGAVDVLTFWYDGTNCNANLGKNYN